MSREKGNKACSNSGGHEETSWEETRKTKAMCFQLCLRKENVEGLVLGQAHSQKGSIGMKEGGLQEELQEVVFQGSWQTGTKVQARVTELRKSPSDSQKQLCKRTEGNASESRRDLDCHT